jgi:transposase
MSVDSGCEASPRSAQGCTYLRAQFLRLKSRRGPKKAILGVAASIVTAVYHILKKETTYHDLGPDYFERRSTVHLTRRLIRRLVEVGLSVEVRPAA